jgi:hypothetical protein
MPYWLVYVSHWLRIEFLTPLVCYSCLIKHHYQRIWALYTAAHYKNSPNDLQMLSDAPAHRLFVLLGTFYIYLYIYTYYMYIYIHIFYTFIYINIQIFIIVYVHTFIWLTNAFRCTSTQTFRPSRYIFLNIPLCIYTYYMCIYILHTYMCIRILIYKHTNNCICTTFRSPNPLRPFQQWGIGHTFISINTNIDMYKHKYSYI